MSWALARSNRSASGSCRAFAVIELLIAIFLLAICIALFAQCFLVGRHASRHADHLGTGVLLAQQEMEQAIVSKPGEGTTTGKFSQPYSDYTYKITQKPWSDNNKLTMVKVEIFYDRQPTYFVETLVLSQ